MRRSKRQIAEEARSGTGVNGHVSAAVESRPEVKGAVWADQLTAAPTRWICDQWIPLGSVVLIGGPSHVGKSMYLSALVAQVTGGPIWLAGDVTGPAAAVWYTTEETPRGKVVPRLVAAGADMSRVLFPGYDAAGRIVSRLALPGDSELLRRTLVESRARLAILDPISSYLGAGVSRRDETHVRFLLETLEQVAWESECTITVTLHDRKSQQGPAVQHFGGSGEWTQTTRTVLRLGYDPREHGRRILSAHKSGHADTPPASRYYTRVESPTGLRLWLGEECAVAADDLAGEPADAAERDALRDAEAFLSAELHGQEQWSKDMVSRAAECGISSATLRRARVNLGVTTHQVVSGGRSRWMWRARQTP